MNRQEIGLKIKAIRKERGMVQKELAKAFGCSRPAMSDMENGVTKIGIEDLQRLCRILDVSILRFLPLNAPVSPDEDELMLYYRQIPQDLKSLFLETAQSYAARKDDQDQE